MFKYYLKLAIFLLLSSTWINAANANTTLQCEVTSYQQALNSGYTLEWAKSWVPERFDAEIDETGIIRVGDYQKHLITNSHSGDKIEFTISIPDRDDGAVIKGTYFKKKQKFAVKVDYDVRYIDSGLIWGVCKEINNLSKNEMLYLSLDNCNSFTEVCLNDTCINVCKAEDLYMYNEWGQDNLIIYTQLKNCPIGFTRDKNLDLDIIIEDSETLEQKYYTYCRAISNYHYKNFAGQAPEKSIPMLQLFQGNECPFGEADVWIETANGQTIVGCYDNISSKEFLMTAEDTTDALIKAQQEAEELKQQLAELQSQQSQTQQATSADTQIPLITITRSDTDDKQGIVAGRVSDNVGVAEVTVDGNIVPFSSNGSFEYSTYVPATGKTVEVQVTDLAGLSSSQTVTLERNVNLATASISFDELNPIAKPAKRNNNALALIIGVSDYENTTAKAIFADTDAIVFRDYASEKLGIPNNRIKTLVNDGADIREFLLSTKNWLIRSVKQDQTDVYVFFAGHGLASDDGEQMYLLPYDGSPELLDRTAILRDELFSDIASANPRSVTVFLDTCYSGSTRGSEILIAARPILLKAKESEVPEGFTIFTAAAGDETAKPLEEAKHGLFSYFLMKGMEGDADTNGDKQITAGELHAYVKSNVVQQSSGTQTPELQGDADRVLVRFQ